MDTCELCHCSVEKIYANTVLAAIHFRWNTFSDEMHFFCEDCIENAPPCIFPKIETIARNRAKFEAHLFNCFDKPASRVVYDASLFKKEVKRHDKNHRSAAV